MAGLLAGESRIRASPGETGLPRHPLRQRPGCARQVLSELQALGVDYDDGTSVLEDNGPAVFDASWQDLGDQLATQLRKRSTREENRA